MPDYVSRRQFNQTLLGLSVLAKSPGLYAESPSSISQLYAQADATALAALVKRGDVSALELLDEAIRRTERLNPKLNAITLKHYAMARDYLRQQPVTDGAFAGVPFLLKDLGVQLAATVTTAGSRSLINTTAAADSEIVRRYKQAGLVIFGKTNTPEFGMALTTEPLLHGPCRNPWNLEHSTGGSSGGSAAAVAAGIVPIAHGTDGGGSIRVPASACGVFGFKPSRALTPTHFSPAAFSIGHILSKSVRDSAAMLDATAGSVAGAPYATPGKAGGYLAATLQGPKSLKVALNLTEPAVAIDAEVQAAVKRCALLLEQLGHRVEVATPGIDYERLNAAQETMMLAEFANGMQRLEKALGKKLQAPLLEPLSVQFMQLGQAISAQTYLDAWQTAKNAAQIMGKFHQQWDVMLQPVTATPAPKLNVINGQAGDDERTFVDRFRQYSAFTHLQNMTGQPAASVPVSLSSNGLPLAAMLTTAIGEDASLFAICSQLEREQAFPFNKVPVMV